MMLPDMASVERLREAMQQIMGFVVLVPKLQFGNLNLGSSSFPDARRCQRSGEERRAA